MSDPATLTGALVAFGGLLYKVRELRRDPHNPAVQAICGLLASLGAALLVGWKPTYLWLGDVTGVPNIAVLGRHGFAMVAAVFAQALVNNIGDPQSAPRRGRLRWALYGVAVTSMIGLFVVAPVHDMAAPDDFTDRYAVLPSVAFYLLTYLVFMAVAVVGVVVTNTRYARHAPRRSLLRTGIYLTTASAYVGLVYIVHKGSFIVVGLLGQRPPWEEWRISRILVVTAVVLLTVGLLLPSVGRLVGGAVRWPRRYRLYRALHPLWKAIFEVAPQVVLNPPVDPGRDRLMVRQLTTALYRRVIEISDGIQLIRPHADMDAVRSAERRAKAVGYGEEEVRAITEAALVATALHRRTQVTTSSQPSAPVPGADTSDAAAEHLARVAWALEHSPIVTQAVGRLSERAQNE